MITNKTLLNDIKAFCEKHDMKPSGFSRKFLGYPNFVSDLESETFSPTLKTVNKVLKAMKEFNPRKGKIYVPK